MTIPVLRNHMSKKEQRIQNEFPPLQRRIVLHLAQTDPQNIYQTKKAIKADYKSAWNAFDALKKKGLIKQVTLKDYQGRKYPQFWITDLGIFLAMSEGVKSEILLRRTVKIYPEDKNLQFIIETVPILGKHALNVLRLAALTNGQMKDTDVNSILAAQMQRKFSPEVIRQFIEVAKKYPEQHQRLVDSLEQTRKNLSELSDLL